MKAPTYRTAHDLTEPALELTDVAEPTGDVTRDDSWAVTERKCNVRF